MILIVCAMESEAKTIRNSIENLNIFELTPQEYYYKGTIKNKKVTLIVTGVGKVNAAALTSLVLSKEDFKYIINIGYAGGVKPYKVGDVVVVKDASYHDVDVTSVNSIYEYGQIPHMPHPFLSNYNLVVGAQKALNASVLSLYTGDKFMVERFKEVPAVYDMEAAAIYQVAHIFNTPVVSIKFVSDIIDSETQKQDYKKSEEKYDDLLENILKKVLTISLE